MVLNFIMTKDAGCHAEMQEEFVRFLEQTKAIPKKIHVKKEEVMNLFRSITDKLGIKVELKPELPALDEAKFDMRNNFM